MTGPRRLNFDTVPSAPPAAPVSAPPAPPSLSTLVQPPSVASVPAVQAAPVKLPITLDQVGQVGGDIQGQIATVTSKITGVAKTSDMDEMGKLLTDTIMAAKGYDPKNLFKNGLWGLLKAKKDQISMKFDNVDKTVDRLVQQVDQHINKFRQRVGDLDQLAIANKQYHDSLQPQIDYLNETADWMEQNQPQVDPNDPMSAQYVQDWLTVINFARKRADDLHRAKVLAQQQAAQIQQMKTNSTALAQKFGDIKVTTIPAMKQTFTLYVINMEQKKGAEFADQIDSTNDQVLKRNAELLGQNTTAIQTSLNRSNISMDALQANYDSIVRSLDETLRIQKEEAQRRKNEQPKLEQLSQDLSARLARPAG